MANGQGPLDYQDQEGAAKEDKDITEKANDFISLVFTIENVGEISSLFRQ